MTLVLSVHSRDSLWVVVDRRLSFRGARPPTDDAVKLAGLETKDGVGVLAYAGLGATPRGTQPSDWMSAVLRGRGGINFEHALSILAETATSQLPRYLMHLPGGAHTIVVPAFVKGRGARVYSIDNVVDPARRQHWYRYTTYQRSTEVGSPSPRVVLAGTGGAHLASEGSEWRRELLNLANKHDRDRIPDLTIADRLAELSYETHKVIPDTVGPRSIVIWRRRRDIKREISGGGHQFYTATQRERGSSPIPQIANGLDVTSIGGVLMEEFRRRIDEHGFSAEHLEFETEDINRMLSQLPSGPDDKLR